MKSLCNLALIGYLFLIIGCENEDRKSDIDPLTTFTPTTISPPPDQEFDLDDDLIPDISVKYRTLITLDEPSTGSSIIGSIECYDKNKILYSDTEGNLFPTLNYTLKKETQFPLSWSPLADIVSIDGHREKGWGKTWDVNSNEKKNNYYIGLYLDKDAQIKIGWIKMSIDTLSGQVILLDKEFTAAETLVITR